MHFLLFLVILWLVAKLLRGVDPQERLLAEQRITNEHLRRIREQSAWARIRGRFVAEHGMTIEDYASRYGLPLAWIKAWGREVDAASR
jgi:hypothetical protein